MSNSLYYPIIYQATKNDTIPKAIKTNDPILQSLLMINILKFEAITMLQIIIPPIDQKVSKNPLPLRKFTSNV